jgi:hypothetical protein
MIQQTVMPFKLKRTPERITARSGLAIYAEFMKVMGVDGLVSKHMPKPGSGKGIFSINYVQSISMMLYGGGESIEDVREIREDKALREAIGFGQVPSASATGDWLKRMGVKGGIVGLEQVNREISRKLLNQDKRKGYTLIIDPSIIEAEKREAKMTYLGVKGYRPVVATLKEPGLVIAYEFKAGNDNGGKLKIIKQAFSNIPEGKKIELVLLDNEYYCNEVIEFLTDKGVRWAIAVDKDSAVLKAIGAIACGEWQPFKNKDGIATGREIAETVHATNKGQVAFRLVVLRWRDKQGSLFENSYHYHCIATSLVEESAHEVVWQYNERSQIENHIKELKGGFGMDRLPSGDFAANAVYFGIGIMTYNLFIAQKLFIMPDGWKAKTIKSIRWLMVEVAGKLIAHGRRVILKLSVGMEKYRIYLEMRQRIYKLALE